MQTPPCAVASGRQVLLDLLRRWAKMYTPEAKVSEHLATTTLRFVAGNPSTIEDIPLKLGLFTALHTLAMEHLKIGTSHERSKGV